jgi:hypothetical protein
MTFAVPLLKWPNDDTVVTARQAEGLYHSSRGHRARNAVCLRSLRPVKALQSLLRVFAPPRLCVKKGRNCETNPISFTTSCPSIANNENFSLLTKSKSYGVEDRACGLPRQSPALRDEGGSRLLKPILTIIFYFFPYHQPSTMNDFGRLRKATEARGEGWLMRPEYPTSSKTR